MFHEPRSSLWGPSASLVTLERRAHALAQVRRFFAARDVFEVDTPLMGETSAFDPYIHSFSFADVFLQTSPEFFMKRLLAAGSGSIYQLGKVFRRGESGSKHHPEFTMLEWYRPGWSLDELIAEVEALFIELLGCPSFQYVTYGELFREFCRLDPHVATKERCEEVAREAMSDVPDLHDKDEWLHFLMSHCVEPFLNHGQPLVVTDFPASQAALAKLKLGEPAVAARFEVFYKGFELANGYDELTDPHELRQRFEWDNTKRRQMGLEVMPMDEKLLASTIDMPACSGVAVGFDRLVQIAFKKERISEVLSFV